MESCPGWLMPGWLAWDYYFAFRFDNWCRRKLSPFPGCSCRFRFRRHFVSWLIHYRDCDAYASSDPWWRWTFCQIITATVSGDDLDLRLPRAREKKLRANRQSI